MTGIEQLYPQNHTLYVQVQRMLNLRMKYDDICDIIGLVGSNRVNELCEWFIDYKSPKPMPLVSTRQVLDVPVRSQALLDKGVRLKAWQRQREGARAALEAIGQ